MAQIQEKMTARDKEVKEQVIELLINEGYGTYARRLREFDFIVADIYHGCPIEVAAMFPDSGEICINTAFLDSEETFKQLSLVVRHELLHFLLMHEKRLFDHLAATDPDFEKTYRKASIHELANIAMDWDLSREGYDDHDKQVAKNLKLNGQVIGGLVLSEDKPEWLDKPMEEIFDLLRKEHEEQVKNNPNAGKKPKVTLQSTSHSPEYRKAYNDAIAKYDDSQYSTSDLVALIDKLDKGEDI